MLAKATCAAALMILAAVPAQAAYYSFKLSGSGINAVIHLAAKPNPNTGVLPLTSPNPVDPIGSYVVTGISGTFADAAIDLPPSAIEAIVPSNPAHPEPGNHYAPHSFGFYHITNGVPSPDGTAPGLSYDNLFYPGGSPQTASDYTFHGGLLDIYGLVFRIAGGDAVNIWSNGDMGGGVTFGAAVTDGTSVLDYTQEPVIATAVPEPASWMMMLGGFMLAGAALRRRMSVVA